MTLGRRWTAAVAAAALLASACGGAPAPAASAREAWDRFMQAMVAGDGAAAARLYDSDARAALVVSLRDRRERVRRGDDAAQVLAGTGLAREDLDLSDEAMAGLHLVRASPVAGDLAWFRESRVESEHASGADESELELRGSDGTARRIWFLREPGGWVLDSTRTHRGF
ncbi:MAG: hypothetical protein HMLKMBBP_03842 [Planctomycetes bacterium]|nr:hypothetical protein [Planctomycetota bacterium]